MELAGRLVFDGARPQPDSHAEPGAFGWRFPWGDEPDATFSILHGVRRDATISPTLERDGCAPGVGFVRTCLLAAAYTADLLGRPMSVSRSHGWYPSRFLRVPDFSFGNVVTRGVDWLVANGLLDEMRAPPRGPRARAQAWQSRYWVTEQGRALCEASALFPNVYRIPGLRGRRVRLVDRATRQALEAPETEKAAAIHRFSAALSEATAGVQLEQTHVVGRRGDVLELEHPSQPGRRVLVNPAHVEWFAPYLWEGGPRNRLDKGGRFVGHWAQTVPRWGRADLRICGQGVSEVDIVASHIALLYAERKLVAPPSIYERLQEEAGCSRELAKFGILALVNANGYAQGIGALALMLAAERNGLPVRERQRISQVATADRKAARSFYEAAQRVFSPIADAFFSDAGVRLQAKEAEILQEAISRELRQGRIAVPMHDGLMIPAGQESGAAEAVEAAFHKVTKGGRCGVEVKPPATEAD